MNILLKFTQKKTGPHCSLLKALVLPSQKEQMCSPYAQVIGFELNNSPVQTTNFNFSIYKAFTRKLNGK